MNTVCIITALPAESRVFIDAMNLRRIEQRGLHLYAAQTCLLLQTGVGKLAAAATTSALLQARPDVCAVINCGIAGGMAEIGTTHLAHCIRDTASGRAWYPHLPSRRTLPAVATAELHTQDQPVNDYRKGVLYDMEASGVVCAASLYLSSDAIQAIKVVSDNPDNPWQTLSSARVTNLMQATVPVIQQLLEEFQSMQPDTEQAHRLDACLSAITQQVHHSVNDRHQLRRLLQRHQVLTGTLPAASLPEVRSARQLRQHLRQGLHNTPLYYAD